MVGIILILFSLLAFSFMTQSQSSTSITGISIYGMQAHQLAMGFADEAKVVLMEKFDEIGGNAPWKAELISMLAGQTDGPAVTFDRPDFQNQLGESMALLQSIPNAKLVLCSLRLHGFHRLHYAANDIYDGVGSFYKSETLDPDDSAREPVEDWVGYATLQIRISIRGIERQVQVTHDLKIVDTQPPAREFAFFVWAPLTDEMTSSGLAHASLNQGGSMAIWPMDVGRVMIRGPYALLTEGDPNGEGGERRGGNMRKNFSYPDDNDDWYGWSVVPGNRALRWNKIAMPWGSNIRPSKDGTFVKVRVRWPTKDFVSVDSGTSVADCPSQTYFCAATDVGKQAFSPWGRPGSGVTGPGGADDLSMFRGYRLDFNNGGGEIVGNYEDGKSFGGGSTGDGITCEGGGLISIMNQAKYNNNFGLYACISTGPGYPWCFGVGTYTGFYNPCVFGLPCIGVMLGDMNHSPPLDPSTYDGGASGTYLRTTWSLRYWEEEPVDMWASLIGVAVSAVAAYISAGGEGMGTTLFESGATSAATDAGTDAAAQAAADGASEEAATAAGTSATEAAVAAGTKKTMSQALQRGMENFDWGSFMSTMGDQIVNSVTTNLAGTMLAGSTGTIPPTSQELSDSIPEGLFPPKYREYMRGTTRLHRTLKEALSSDESTLNLDGIILVERMPEDQPASFKYRGRGILVSMTDGTANLNPFLGDITPEDPSSDWMTFAHLVKRAPLPDGGDGQVKLQSTNLELSLYSSEGVIAEQQSSIFGNYICAWPNKYKVIAGVDFDVFYNAARLAPSRFGGPADDEWTNGTWKRVTVSPKLSGYYDRYR
jgi:hypothetical protein